MAFNSVPFHGKTAKITKNNVVVGFECGWDININVDTVETNRKGQDWKEVLAGQAGWDGSAKFHFVAGNTEQKALMDNIIATTPGALLTDIDFLLDSTSNALVPSTGLILTGMPISAPIGDKVSVSITFKGTGVLTLVSNHT
jgi:hypothetical protein